MRISDWSSDVCSSDLHRVMQRQHPVGLNRLAAKLGEGHRDRLLRIVPGFEVAVGVARGGTDGGDGDGALAEADGVVGAAALQLGADDEALGVGLAVTASRLVGGGNQEGKTLLVGRSEEHTSELQSLMRIS